MTDACHCRRIERIASVAGVDYVRCLDCGRIIEMDDLDSVPAGNEEEDEEGGHRGAPVE